MRDDRARWPAPVTDDKPLDLGGALLQPVLGLTQTLISGADVRTQTGLTLLAWPNHPTTESYAISLRRDRILCIGNTPFDEGWHPDKALAVSDMTDGYTVFDLVGDGALDLLNRGGGVSKTETSASVVRMLFGLDVFLYSDPSTEGFRIHVNSAHDSTLISHLRCGAQIA